MSKKTVRIRVLSEFMLPGGRIAEVGEVIEVDPIVAYDLPRAWGERLAPEDASPVIDAAARAATEQAARKSGPAPGDPRSSFVRRY